MRIPTTLPEELLSQIGAGVLCFRSTGRLGDLHYHVRLDDGSPGFLKVGEGTAAEEVRDESDRLAWIDGRAGAPRVLSAFSDGDLAILLLSECSGHPSHDCVSAHNAHEVVRLLGQSLRAIHSIPVDDCPFNNVVEREIALADRRLAEGLIDTRRFTDETGRSPAEVLADLKATAGNLSDTVFTHGDYALPNVILDSGRLAGVVDWSQAGISSRNRDFMSIEKSIARNCGDHQVQHLTDEFYQHYEMGQPDREQIQFFWKLDQFWVHTF